MILEDLTMDEWMDLRYEEGITTGLAKGRDEGREQVARNSLAVGLSIEIIQKITGLSREDIVNL
ncbi:MAG: hypothetical protein LBU88_04980 [Treponema sp.]|jgi:predicted transposase/invertase (TIGR01784 family)|nr:hypothetical protein [Treponema sp.]